MLSQLVESPPFMDHPIDRQKNRLLGTLITGIGIITVVSIAVLIITDVIGFMVHPPSLYWAVFMFCFSLIGILLLNKHGKTIIAGLTLIIVLVFAITFADDVEKAIEGSTSLFYVIPIMLACYFLRPVSGFVVAGGVSVLHLYIWFFTDVQESFTPFGMIAFFAIALISWLAANSNEKLLYGQHEANKRLKELDQLKSKFVSDVSHELRTPLNNIHIHIELLAHADFSDEERDHYIQNALNETERLSNQVVDILDLSRIESGVETNSFSVLDANDVVQRAIEEVLLQARRKGLVIDFRGEQSPCFVRGSKSDLHKVFRNLLINAVRHSHDGSILVRVNCKRDIACIEIKDQGTGIDPKDLPHIFDRFYRGQGVRQSTQHGMGLGLAIANESVKQHGGDIGVTSQPGKGSTFRVNLPVFVQEPA